MTHLLRDLLTDPELLQHTLEPRPTDDDPILRFFRQFRAAGQVASKTR